MSVVFQTEPFKDFWPEARSLLLRHWEEIAARDITGPLDVNREMYEAMDAAGMLHITTAREAGELIGYAVYFLTPHPHYRALRTAEADVFFLAPEQRKGLTGPRLLRTAERVLAERGANVIVQKVKTAHDCGAVFRRMGYSHTENVWMKAVRHGV